jgi:hypothetical protein
VGSMKKVLSVLVAFVCAVVLSSCSLVPSGFLFDTSDQRADARMTEIAAALNSHDAVALKAMFSKRARAQATDLDAGLDYLLSFFPNGGVTWKRHGVNSEGIGGYGKKTTMLSGFYILSADGKDYWLYFADFTVNDAIDPENVGIYGLGVTPWTDDIYSGPADAFWYWASKIHYDESDPDGYPGVYVGYDNSELSLHRLPEIVEELNTQDHLGLEERFTAYAQAEHGAELKDGIDKLYALLPGDEVAWQKDQQAAPIAREKTDSGGTTLLLLSTYRVSSGGVDYRLFCADFRENAADHSNLGIYAIGVAPWTDSGDSAAEKALSAWADAFDVDASVPPGIFISQ